MPPEAFGDTIPPIQSVGTDASVIGQSLLLALLFLLLAAFPSQLLNKTLEENYVEVAGWFAIGGAAATRFRNGLSRFWRSWLGLIFFLLLSALLYGFLSPQFGPTVNSFASLIGILAGLVIVIAAFELPLVFFHRSLLQERGRLRVQPLTIFIAVACVVISRISDFQPGYLYGLVVGYVFARELPLREEGRANVFTALWMIGVALAAWLALPFANSALNSTPLLQIAVIAGLSTIFVAGLEGLLFELVPLKFLRGESVFLLNKVLWAFLFVAAAFTFVHIMLTPASGYFGTTKTSPLFAAVLLFVGFGIFSVLFWAYFRFRPERPEASAPPPPTESAGAAPSVQ